MPTASTKATAQKGPPSTPLIVLGFDEQRKPCGARFTDAKPDLVEKAAKLMGMKVYVATSEDLAEVAESLPAGRLFSTGRGFVPNIRQNVYSEAVVTVALDPQGKVKDKDTVTSSGMPPNWETLAAGHLILAQESAEYGWWEAVVVKRDGEILTLQYRDFPNLPRFPRHFQAVALMRP
jgi:hypothetical protein